MDPQNWKTVTKSPFALKSKFLIFGENLFLAFKRDLKEFRDEMTAKREIGYIPVTMDELMARFVTNMERNDCKEQFRTHKVVVQKENLAGVAHDRIEDSIINSMQALKDLLSNNTVDTERQPNSESNLYLKLMEKA